ncbi:MAG: peptidylprolyl isomerase, partial [Alphaproteobacteria bacterium]
MQTVSVNGVIIEERCIAAETQNADADSAEGARAAAARALVIRTLLLQEAQRLQLQPAPRVFGDGVRETDEDALIRQLLDREITVPQADAATCRRYY